MSRVLADLGVKVYSSAMSLHRQMTQQRYQSKSPVISIGNLSMGGTGKTPFCQYLSRQLVQDFGGVKFSVVTRGYGGKVRKPELASDDWRQCGDETVLLYQSLPNATIACGPKKWQTVQWLDQNENLDFHLIDDGFQHWALSRDLDIVLVDATEGLQPQFPKGRAREPIEALRRADLVVLTKVNLVASSRFSELESRIREFGKPVSKFYAQVSCPVIGPCVLVTGVGNPEAVARSVMQAGGVEILRHLVFADHHGYTERDWGLILRTARASGALTVLTTEKDRIKFSPSWKPVESLSYQLLPENEEDHRVLMGCVAKALKRAI